MAQSPKVGSTAFKWRITKNASGTLYDIVHLGMSRDHTSRHNWNGVSLNKLEDEFQARSAYLLPGYDPSPLLEVDGFKRQADYLLDELRKEEQSPGRPIIFVCCGTAGGILLKQTILQLIDRTHTDGDLYNRISGVFFLGCQHDERDEKFGYRTFRTLTKEFGNGNWDDLDAFLWKPRVEWIIATTARFRSLKLSFPVWTYYESKTMKVKVYGQDRKYQRILCPSEVANLDASPSRKKTLSLNHDGIRTIDVILDDLRTTVETFIKKKPDVSRNARNHLDRTVGFQRLESKTMDPGPRNHEWTANTNKQKADPYRKAPPTASSTSKELSLEKSDPMKSYRPFQPGLKAHDSLPDVVAEGQRDRSRDSGASSLFQPRLKTSPAIIEFKVGWICALPFEAAAAETMLDEQYPDPPLDPHASTLYTLGRVGPHSIVIACLPRGRPGLSAASVVARGMLERFRGIKFGFMVGIGGGVPSARDDIRLGDVVVSQPNLEHGGVVQYDFGKAEEGGMFRRTGHLNNPPPLLLSVLNRVQTNHERGRRTYPLHMARYAEEDMEEYTFPKNERDKFFRVTYPHPAGTLDCNNCDPNEVVERPARNANSTRVKIHYGTIASGNQVIKDGQTRDRIVKDLGGQVLCFETEAAGLMNDFPCLVIRGISDYCDSHKNDGWQRYAAASAAAYTRELLLLIPPGEVAKSVQS